MPRGFKCKFSELNGEAIYRGSLSNLRLLLLSALCRFLEMIRKPVFYPLECRSVIFVLVNAEQVVGPGVDLKQRMVLAILEDG